MKSRSETIREQQRNPANEATAVMVSPREATLAEKIQDLATSTLPDNQRLHAAIMLLRSWTACFERPTSRDWPAIADNLVKDTRALLRDEETRQASAFDHVPADLLTPEEADLVIGAIPLQALPQGKVETCLMADCTEPQAHFCVTHVLEVHCPEVARVPVENYSLLRELYDCQLKLDERNFAKGHSFEEWAQHRKSVSAVSTL